MLFVDPAFHEVLVSTASRSLHDPFIQHRDPSAFVFAALLYVSLSF
jgi:hypothetical protein